MDSRIRQVLEIVQTIKRYPYLGYDVNDLLDKAISLLTAEPELCKDDRSIAERLLNVNGFGWVHDSDVEDVCQILKEYASHRLQEMQSSQKDMSGLINENRLQNGQIMELTNRLQEEQASHEQIASICFAAGIETPDGTSIGAVRNLVNRLQEMQAELKAARMEHETARDLYAEAQAEVERLRELIRWLRMEIARADVYQGWKAVVMLKIKNDLEKIDAALSTHPDKGEEAADLERYGHELREWQLDPRLYEVDANVVRQIYEVGNTKKAQKIVIDYRLRLSRPLFAHNFPGGVKP